MTLDQYLRRHQIVARQFAGTLGVHPSKLTRLRRGQCKPSLELALRIGRETGGAVAPEDFLSSAAPAPASSTTSHLAA